jgi:hypothetical protein
LPKVDHIIVLQRGQISEAGPYQDLMQHNRAFAQFLKTYLVQDDDDDPESEILLVTLSAYRCCCFQNNLIEQKHVLVESHFMSTLI